MLNDDAVWDRLQEKVTDMIRAKQSNLVVIVKLDPDEPKCADKLTEEKKTEGPPFKKSRSEDDDVIITKHVLPPSPEVLAQHLKSFREWKSMQILCHDEHHTKVPWISVLSLRYFCVPASSVPSKRIFSLAGNMIRTRTTCSSSCIKMQTELVSFPHFFLSAYRYSFDIWYIALPYQNTDQVGVWF
jgi:hypothetical protein